MPFFETIDPTSYRVYYNQKNHAVIPPSAYTNVPTVDKAVVFTGTPPVQALHYWDIGGYVFSYYDLHPVREELVFYDIATQWLYRFIDSDTLRATLTYWLHAFTEAHAKHHILVNFSGYEMQDSTRVYIEASRRLDVLLHYDYRSNLYRNPGYLQEIGEFCDYMVANHEVLQAGVE